MERFHVSATGHSLNYLPEYIATRHGFFKEQGLEVTASVPKPWPKVLTALAEGTAEAALGGIWVPSMYRNRVKSYTVFAQVANRSPLALIGRGDKKSFKIAEVAGKTVLMKSGGGASVGMFFKMLLRENGVDPRNVDFIQDLDGEMLGELFEGGMGDFFVNDNVSARAMASRNSNVAVVMEMVSEGGEIPWSVYYRETEGITSEVLDKYRRFCIGLKKGMDWILENDAETFKDELVELFPAVPADVLVGLTNAYRKDGMWTTPTVSDYGYKRWQKGIADARLTKEPFARDIIINDEPATLAQKN